MTDEKPKSPPALLPPGAASRDVSPWYVARPKPAVVAGTSGAPGGRILLVGAVEHTRASVGAELRRQGFQVQELGAELDPSTVKVDADVILVDLAMGEASGLALVQAVRARDETRGIPIIVLSDHTEPDQVVRALGAGASDIVSKPVQLEILAARLGVHLSNKRALERVQRHNQLHRDLLRIASHDLRNPMAAVMLNLQFLDRRSAPFMPPEERKLVRRAVRNAQFSLDLLENLLELVNLEGGVGAVRHTDVNVAQVVDEVMERHAARAEEKRVELVSSLPEMPTTVRGDAIRLQQVLNNLMSNALKATPDGGRVELRVTVQPQTVNLDVVDHGPGIPAEVQARLFQGVVPHARAESGEKSTGLGLMIARRLVELQGGTLVITSAEGVGTTASVRLPR
ncbi:MAG: HAMP domain-containing sensor histidine kinase [Myxococcota bacterium]